MTIPFKPRVAKPICRIDRKAISATLGVDFLDIDSTINGEGSEVYDKELYLRCDDTCDISMTLNSLSDYSQDYVQGRSSTPSANNTASVSSIPVLRCDNITNTPLIKIKITGYVGDKRHIQIFNCGHDGTELVKVASFYTADTSTELTSIQFKNSTTKTITFTCVGFAVPKIQYNPHAILLDHKVLTNQTADIIYGGVNDTEGVEDLDGDLYDYAVHSSGLTSGTYLDVFINEITTGNKIAQRIYNSNGSLTSLNNSSAIQDSFLTEDASVLIKADTGRKKITKTSFNRPVSAQQSEDAFWNPDTSTKMTSLMLRPSSSTNGDIWLYAVPKGYNADLTPWTFRQVYSVDNASFSTGATFDIPSWAILARIQAIGESTSGSNIEIDFSTTTTVDKQYLKSSTTSTTSLISTNRSIGRIEKVSNIDCVIALKSGANRPVLSKTSYNENTIDLNALWAKDSSTNYTSLTLNADNTNTMTAKFIVSFI